jgi:hypothetical protein
MANIVVLPRIEIDNPFSELAEILKNKAIPMIGQLAMNKEQIAILSDTELTDHIPVLKRFAPELLTQDGKIDWNKVEEYLQSDDLFKQEVASYLINTRRRREEFKNLPIGAKLEQLDVYGAKTNPQILKKEFMRHIILTKYQEAINNSDLSEDAKLFLLAHAPYFAELTVNNPAYFNAFLNILAKHSKKQDETKQESGTGGWRLSLGEGGQKKFGIRLEMPQLNFPQISPPQVPKKTGIKRDISGKKHSPPGGTSGTGQVKPPPGGTGGTGQVEPPPGGTGGTGQVKPPPGGTGGTGQVEPPPGGTGGTGQVENKTTKNQQLQMQTSDEIFFPSEVPYAPDVKSILSREELKSIGKHALIDLALLALLKDPRFILRTVGKVAGRVIGGKAGKKAQQVAENVAKETTQNVASQQAKTEAQNVAGQVSKSKYDIRREELRKRIEKQMKENKELDRELQKRAERLKNLLEDYKAFQKQAEELERNLKKLEPEFRMIRTTKEIEEALKRTTDPKRKESLKKLLELKQRLDEIERQLRKEHQDLVKKLHTKYPKALKLEAKPVKPEQIEKIKALKPYKLMPPKEQLLEEEIYTSLLQPLQRGQRKIDFMIDTSKILNLEKIPQPPTVNEIVRQFLNPTKTTQKTQTKKSQKRQTKKKKSNK